MSYVLWHRDGQARIASARVVLRAAEVPRLTDAIALREALERLHAQTDARATAAADAARAAAHDAGLAEGRRLAGEALAERLAELSRAAEQERERVRNDLGALALQVVRKLLGHFADDDVLLALADRAAADVLPERPLALVVHPDRFDGVRERLERSAAESPLHRCGVRADPLCEVDACRLETAHGGIDASLDAQLARLEAAWTGESR
jgi:type III secretion protein L